MSDESQYIPVGKGQLHYLRWGSGKRLLLAFHGYGDDAEQYRPLVQYLDKDYTILSFDLPHHGKSKWADNTTLTPKDLMAMVETLKAKYGIDKVSMIGYSMGGRVALTVLEDMPGSIDKITLIASDGLTVNGYFYLFTRTWLGKKIFRNMLEKPQPYFAVMNWLNNRKLVDASRYKFVMHFLQSAASRDFLLRVWPAMSSLIPRPARLRALIRQYRIPVAIFMGAYDRIMPPSIAARFRSGLDMVQLHVLEKGHRILDNENAKQIAESLL